MAMYRRKGKKTIYRVAIGIGRYSEVKGIKSGLENMDIGEVRYVKREI